MVSVFLSYADEDVGLKLELEKHLSSLQKQNIISTWSNRNINAGDDRKQETDKQLSTADIILLLISPDFMASDYCYSTEMRQAIERHENNESQVIPIMLRHTHFYNESFSKLQPLPTGGKPVKSWNDLDEAFLNIAKGVQRVALDLKKAELEKEINKHLTPPKQYREALNLIDQLIQIDPRNANAFLQKGIALYNKSLSSSKDNDDRIKSYEVLGKAIQLNPNLAEAYYYQTRILSDEDQEKNLIAALKLIEKAVKLEPNSSEFHYEKTYILIRLKNYEQAHDAIDKAISLSPNTTQYYEFKSIIYGETGAHYKAIEMLDNAILVEKDEDEIIRIIREKADIFIDVLKSPEEAQTVLDQAILDCQDDFKSILYFDKGKIFFEEKVYRRSLESFDQALVTATTKFETLQAQLGRAYSLLELKEYDQALISFNTALELEPNNVSAYKGKGEIYKNLASNSFKKAEQIERQNKRSYTSFP